jgi:hypothetical protein
MEEHYTGCQHSTLFVLNGWHYAAFFSVLQYISDVAVVFCCMNSTISSPFLSQKTSSISFLADDIYFNFFGLFGKCVHPLL